MRLRDAARGWGLPAVDEPFPADVHIFLRRLEEEVARGQRESVEGRRGHVRCASSSAAEDGRAVP